MELGTTQPGSGSTVTEDDIHKPRFKEQVIGKSQALLIILSGRTPLIDLLIYFSTGYAKEIRGKALGNVCVVTFSGYLTKLLMSLY